jgi:hypothetical protein
MMHDSGGPRRVKPMLERLGAKVWDPSKVVVITDHYVPTYDDESRKIIRIARDWVRMTWSNSPTVVDTIVRMMMGSWEANVSYETPLGVAHQFRSSDHYGPMPNEWFQRDDWSPVYYNKADSAGLVLGARVPIILTSRADSVRSKDASCGVAMLAAHARRQRQGA